MNIANERDNDTRYMLEALELAKKGIGKTYPNPVVGCVIVKNGRVSIKELIKLN